ncbi:M23 family metallopeptidase [Segnochrobactrum spirostomi]|uniref:M23 family metallopeptidase n=1 Tax=Segnochrobactrum spirostomi TaxID=2608987 RepID=A0A6A7Y480_9HYPH|nr:M23 family metallopeptidase [Segnochrobactrum spirostomi]MQT13535.1 M23 family metallopeptidase [Segnochrobactrum spirostomi]
MKAGKHGQARQRLGSEPVIALGNEPPLFVAGATESDTGRTAISLRWLLGTVLTGVTSIFLMGGALVVALDGRTSAAVTSDADLVAQAQSGQAGDQGQGDDVARAQKGDRMLAPVKPVTNKEVIQVSTVTRQGDRDLIRTKPYIKFTASLETRTDIDASDIPPFDPLKIFSDQDLFPDHGAAESIYGAAVDGEVTLSVQDFPVANPGLDADLSFSSDEVEELVREDGRFQTDKASAFAGAQAPDTSNRFSSFSMLMATPQTQTASLDSNVKIVPENVSEVAKTAASLNKTGSPDTATKTPPKPPADIVVTAAKGDTLKKLLMANSADEDEADEIVSAFRKSEASVTRISAGNKLRIGLGPDPGRPGEFRPERVSVYDATSHLGTVALNDDGDYVAAEEPLDDFVDEGSNDGGGSDEVSSDSQTPTIYNSLYQTALKQGLPDTMVNELVHLFSFGVDFNAHVHQGDKIELFYADDEDGAASNGPPEVLFASLTIGGIEKRFYRFHSNRSGSTDFFDGTGKSAQQFLMRKPITGGIFRSGFGARRHPILGYVRMHPGVDWAAPRGTPVYASGNGVVAEAGWKSGYGRWVLISHGNGYDTGYGHMSGIASGIAPGTKVHQGQVIGYVGSTGLSTGPHLHYEVHINESPVDPLRIRLPSGRELRGAELVAFQKERKRIDDLIGVDEDASSATVARN